MKIPTNLQLPATARHAADAEPPTSPDTDIGVALAAAQLGDRALELNVAKTKFNQPLQILRWHGKKASKANENWMGKCLHRRIDVSSRRQPP